MATRQDILDSDYEPYDNRDRPDQTSWLETLIHLLKGTVGIGILAMPNAFKNAGLIIGIICSIILAYLQVWCLHIMFDCLYFFCKKNRVPYFTYPAALEQGMEMGPGFCRKCARMAPGIVNFFIIANEIGALCVYQLFCAHNIKQVVDLHTDPDSRLSVEVYLIIILPVLILLTYVKNMKKLAIFSNIANWMTLIGLFCIYSYFFDKIEPISERTWVASLRTLPLFGGTAIFSLVSVGMVLTIELNMKDGRQWGNAFGVLNIGMFIVVLFNVFTGFCGYWRYGEETLISITLNIDINDFLAQNIRILFCISTNVSFALHAYCITEILWEQYMFEYMKTSDHQMLWQYFMRTFVVLFVFLLTIAIPYLDLFIPLIGAFCKGFIAIIIPPLLDMCIRWPSYDFGEKNIMLFRDIFLVLFGIFVWSLGTYIALEGIIKRLINQFN